MKDELLDSHLGEKIHPWRLCPIGHHYVREHSEHIPPSKEHPNGATTIRHAHCAKNPSAKNKKAIKDVLSFRDFYKRLQDK